MTEAEAAGYTRGHIRAQDGLRLAYCDYGDPAAPGLPLLCLSGVTRNGADFHSLALRLSRGRRVVCLDYRGRGRSDWDRSGKSYRPEVYLDDLRHLLAALGLGRVVVCGTSLGGFLAMGLGIMTPSALAGVVLNDAGPDPDLQALAQIQRYMVELTVSPPADWAAAKAELKAKLADIGFRDDETWESFTRGTFVERQGALAISWDPMVNEMLRRSGPLPDLWPLFGSLAKVPVLLFRGGNSPFLRAETVSRMQALHPGLTAITVPGAGHTPTLLEPECLGPLDDFLARLDRRHLDG